MPRRYGGECGGQWHLLYTTCVDGTSLAHMLRTVASDAALLVIVRSRGRVFGAFVPELRDPHQPHGDKADSAQSSKDGLALGGLGGLAAHSSAGGGGGSSSSSPAGGNGHYGASAFYGSGESLLFALAELSLPPPPERQMSSPSPSGGKGAAGAKIFAYTYRWTPGANDHFVRSDAAGLYFGSGGSGGGLSATLAADRRQERPLRHLWQPAARACCDPADGGHGGRAAATAPRRPLPQLELHLHGRT